MQYYSSVVSSKVVSWDGDEYLSLKAKQKPNEAWKWNSSGNFGRTELERLLEQTHSRGPFFLLHKMSLQRWPKTVLMTPTFVLFWFPNICSTSFCNFLGFGHYCSKIWLHIGKPNKYRRVHTAMRMDYHIFENQNTYKDTNLSLLLFLKLTMPEKTRGL